MFALEIMNGNLDLLKSTSPQINNLKCMMSTSSWFFNISILCFHFTQSHQWCIYRGY